MRATIVVARLMAANFAENRFLSPKGATELLARFGEGEIAGGSVYDALVGATAVEHGLTEPLDVDAARRLRDSGWDGDLDEMRTTRAG